MATLALKIKSKSGQHILKDDSLSLQSRLIDLKSHLTKLTQIPEASLQIRIGFPPSLVSNNDQERLENLGIKNGDTLIVEESSSSNASANSVAVGSGGTSTVAVAPSSGPAQHHVMESESSQQGGVLLRRVVPSDNSCLFTSIGFVLNGKVDTTVGGFMRQIIAESISNDKEQYCDAILGKPNEDYVAWILKPESWGGAIELSILANVYGLEIAVIEFVLAVLGKPNEDYVAWILKPESWGGAIELSILANVYGLEIAVIDTINQIINRFGEDQRFPHRVYLIFDGIHYDPIYWEPSSASGEIQTIFPSSNEAIYHEAECLAKELKQSKQYTDVARFTLKCLQCNQVLTGQSEATAHAKASGHTQFDECNS